MKHATPPTALVQKEKPGDVLKKERKAQNQTAERELHGIFRGRDRDPGEKAALGLQALGEKVQKDLDRQLQEIVSARGTGATQYADQEVSRMLRMLEKRREMLLALHESIALDEDLMDAAHWLITSGSDAEN